MTGVLAFATGRPCQAVRARWVIGADGIASTVAHAVAAPLLTVGRSGSSLLYRYVAREVSGDATGYEWAYGDGAAAGLIPTDDGLACVFAATTPDRLRGHARSGREAAFHRVLDAASPALAERVRASAAATPLRGWAGRPGFLRQAWGPGWARVGDAGYVKDPISAHGMTDALRDAELVAVLGAASGGHEADFFARYQRDRDELSAPLLAAVDEIAAYRWDGSRVRELLRASASAAKAELAAPEALTTTSVATG